MPAQEHAHMSISDRSVNEDIQLGHDANTIDEPNGTIDKQNVSSDIADEVDPGITLKKNDKLGTQDQLHGNTKHGASLPQFDPSSTAAQSRVGWLFRESRVAAKDDSLVGGGNITEDGTDPPRTIYETQDASDRIQQSEKVVSCKGNEGKPYNAGYLDLDASHKAEIQLGNLYHVRREALSQRKLNESEREKVCHKCRKLLPIDRLHAYNYSSSGRILKTCSKCRNRKQPDPAVQRAGPKKCHVCQALLKEEDFMRAGELFMREDVHICELCAEEQLKALVDEFQDPAQGTAHVAIVYDCASCKSEKPEEEFLRDGVLWQACNKCIT
ncbi:hypothetical protein SUNI508_03822 [Seiridium unicorne]|uniref:Stc1 domain-containing protein n=1 Tax=Seiridium unicorne TaxID=138068 RepID=A0ABR2VBA1_9PEZI